MLNYKNRDISFIVYAIFIMTAFFSARLILMFTNLFKTESMLLIILAVLIIITVFVFLIKYPEAGIVFYVSCLGFLDPPLEAINVPEGMRALPFAIILLFALIIYIGKERKAISFEKVYILPVSILILLIAGLLWSPSPIYGFHKVQAYILYNLFIFLGVTLFRGDKERLNNMVFVSVLLGIIVLISSLISFFIQEPLGVAKRFRFMGFSSLSLARSAGLFTISYLLIARLTDSFRMKALLYGMIPLFLFLIYTTGSRMPAISIFIVFLVYLTLIEKRPLLQKIVFMIVFAVISYGVFLYTPEDPRQRYIALYQGEDIELDYRYSGSRRNVYDIGVQAFLSYPLIGLGTGGFSNYSAVSDNKIYPHNLILEVASEFGVIGLSVIVVFLFFNFVIALKSIFKYREFKKKPLALFFGILTFLLAFLNSMTTGDITDNPMIWFGSALMWTAWKTEELTGEANSER
ncbi:MAG: O-antigen ligase family protein [Thermodesulfobacteriota bacterium]